MTISQVKQRYLGKAGTVALIAILSAVPPLSTDMLMPALPEIASSFGVSSPVASFTITEFFIGMSLGMLVLGPVSDRYGRKPVLLVSTGVASAFSLASALSESVALLLSFRFIQSVAAGGMVALGTALVKDCFAGRSMGRMLAGVTAISMLAPLFAPVIGAALLAAAGWRGSFYLLTVLFLVALAGSFLLVDPLDKAKRVQGGPGGLIRRTLSFLRIKRFVIMLLVGSLATGPYMTYLAVSSFAYTGVFGVTPQQFSIFFAGNAVVSLFGALAYMRFGALNARRACAIALGIGLVSALAVLVFGHMAPVSFLVAYAPYSITVNYLRPMITNELLQMREQDAGAASSLINFAFTMIGAIIMTIGSVDLGDYVYSIAISMVACLLLAAFILLFAGRKR